MPFADLKKKSNLSFLQKELEKTVSGRQVDERFWKPEVDASGNGYAVIRFLPAPEGETVPWAKVYSHAFQGPGGWYIENSLTTLGDKDPVGEVNRRLWNDGTEEGKDVARRQKRKLSYYSNIQVIKDPKNPETEGKVFLYKYGKKIFDKIQEAMKPEFADETAINPFDFWSGANFKLKIRRVEGYQNYDKSEFDRPSALFDDDAKLEEIYNKQYDLNDFVAPDKFKTYEALKTRLENVLGLNQPVKRPVIDEEVEDEDTGRTPFESSAPKTIPDPVVSSADEDEEDESLSYFSKLVNS